MGLGRQWKRWRGSAATVVQAHPVGPAQEETREGEKGEWAGGRELDQQARMRKGGEEKKKTFFFLFSRVLATHFQFDFVSNSNLIKTNHYKKIINKGAAACMHQEVTNLIFDFNFTKKYYFPIFECTHNYINKSNLAI